MGLVEVLQDDGDVHVDDDHEVDDDERHEEDDGDEGKAAVAVGQGLVVRITVRRLGRDNLKGASHVSQNPISRLFTSPGTSEGTWDIRGSSTSFQPAEVTSLRVELLRSRS